MKNHDKVVLVYEGGFVDDSISKTSHFRAPFNQKI